MIEITVTKYLTSTNQQLQLMTTYNNYHCQAHMLADLLTIPLMYNLVLWNNFLKKTKKTKQNKKKHPPRPVPVLFNLETNYFVLCESGFLPFDVD